MRICKSSSIDSSQVTWSLTKRRLPRLLLVPPIGKFLTTTRLHAEHGILPRPSLWPIRSSLRPCAKWRRPPAASSPKRKRDSSVSSAEAVEKRHYCGTAFRGPADRQFYAPWHFLYFLPLPQGQGSLRPTLSPVVRRCTGCDVSLPPARLAAASSRSFLRWNSFSSASIVVEGCRVGIEISRGAPSPTIGCAALATGGALGTGGRCWIGWFTG